MKHGRLAVLMYHAIPAGEGRADDGADAHYSVSRETFRKHLAAMRELGLRPSAVRDVLASGAGHGCVGVTFDDGHESNAHAAMDLAAASGNADFFVNPGRVGQRHYLDWAALRDLAKAGMSIQSHGQDHRYMDELDEREIESELATSKAHIEDQLGAPVTLFAPPGGRLRPVVPVIAQRLGYRALCSSSVGLWATGGDRWRIPRLAVLASTGDAQMRRWLEQDAWELTRLRVRHGALTGAKLLLGNRGYERLRASLLGGGTPNAAP